MELIISLFVILCGYAGGQQLLQVQIQDAAPVRLGSTARFRCTYLGDNITVQYVSWVKLGEDGERTFVYEYSEYPPINQAYNDWKGRAVIKTGSSKKEDRPLPREMYGREGSLAEEDKGFDVDRGDGLDVDKIIRDYRESVKNTLGADRREHRDDDIERRSNIDIDAIRRGDMDVMGRRGNMPVPSNDLIYGRNFAKNGGNEMAIRLRNEVKDRQKITKEQRSDEKQNLQNFLNRINGASDLLRKSELPSSSGLPRNSDLASSRGLDDHRERIKDFMFGKNGAVNGPTESTPTLIPVFSSEKNGLKKKKRNKLDMHYLSDHKFVPEPGDLGDVFRGLSSPARHRRQKRDAPVGHVELFLSRVQLLDEATYECVVKPLGGPSMGDTITMVVQVPPEAPFITSSDELPFVEGQNVTLKCQANVGKPAGSISWSILRPGADSILEVPLREVDNRTIKHDNGTQTAISMLTLSIKEDDDGAVYRCIAASGILGPYEARPLAQLPLTVQYPPRGGRILFDTAVGRYYCHARGKPAPTYAWIWLQPDGRQTIMSTNRYLDLRGMSESGYYRFHCLASNIIHGIRHTKVMATKLRVIAPSGPAADTPKVTSAPVTSTPSPPKVQPQLLVSPKEKQKIYQSFFRRAPLKVKPRRKLYRRKEAGIKQENNNKRKRVKHQKLPSEKVLGEKVLSEKLKVLNFKEHVQKAYKENIRSQKVPQMKNKHHSRPSHSREELNDKRMMFQSENRKLNRKREPPKLLKERPKKIPKRRRPSTSDLPGHLELSNVEAPEVAIRGFGSVKLTQRPPHHKKRLKQAVDIIDALIEEHGARTLQPEAREGSFPEDPPTYLQPEGRQAPLPKTTTSAASPEPEITTIKPEESTEEGLKKEGEYEYYYYYEDEDKDTKPDEVEQDVIDVSEMPVQDTPPTTKEREPVDKDEVSPNPHETVSRARPAEYNCGSKPDGVYGAGCRAFYRCRQENAYFIECNTPYVYNKRNGKCGKPDQAPAPCGIWRDCSEKVNRKYADTERGCHHYYTCWHGFFMGHNECNPGLVFNEDLQYCDWPENVLRPCGTASSADGTNTRTAHHAPPNRHYTG